MAADIIAIALSAVWIILVAAFFMFADGGQSQEGGDPLRVVMLILAIFMPIAVIWIGAIAARSAQLMQAETARLQSTIDAMRQAYVAQSQRNGMQLQPLLERKLDAIAAAQRKTESAISSMTNMRDPGARIAPAPSAEHIATDVEGQAALALGTPAEALSQPLSNDDFTRALNFPESEQDAEGFSALRRALKDRQTAKLVRAAQDVLSLLSQDGIYADDLRPDHAQPEVWRKFAEGKRGKEIAPLGGIRDRSSLALSAGRMKQDQIFRDAVHHFLREFDKTFAEFAQRASDQEIVEFSDTRTARAFMLLGRVMGTFD